MKQAMKITAPILLLLIICSCAGHSGKKQHTTAAQDTRQTSNNDHEKRKPRKLQTIMELYSDTNSINLTDKGSFWLLYFEPGKVYFDFNPSCGYWFPTTIQDNKIIFKWA